MQQGKTKLNVDGMVCANCELKIERTLNKLDGVTDIKASYRTGTVTVTYDAQKTSVEQIVRVIEEMDYTVKGQDALASPKAEATKNAKGRYFTIAAGVLIVGLAVFLMFDNSLGLSFLPQIDASMGYGILFVVGLLTSVHCIAMCGGINLSQCIAHQTGEPQTLKAKLRPSLLYNLGRVISYTVIGGIVGALGSVLSFSGTVKGIIAILAGVFMVIMGLNLTGLFPWIKRLVPHMPKALARKARAKKRGAFVVGLLNGLMPCGPLQAMQLYALGTGSFFAGALSMLVFSLGTVPLMFGFGALSSLLSSKFTQRLMKISAVLVIALGVIMAGRGLTQSGLSPVLAADKTPSVTAQVQQDVQLVTTQMKSNVYDPITVKAGIPVKWTITADADALNGCNNPVTIPKYGIQKKLVPGDNVIEFTPSQEGDIVYTCWMGMISGVIHVAANDEAPAATASTQAPAVSTDSPAESPDSNPSPLIEDDAWQVAGSSCCGGTYAAGFENGKFPVDKVAVGEIRDGVQYVSIAVNEKGFEPALVVMQKGVKTVWTINGESLNSCNSSLEFPAYNAQMDLKEGENTIEFTPDRDFSYSCWMGMLNGYVKVVDDISSFDLEAVQQEAAGVVPDAAGAGGGCCG